MCLCLQVYEGLVYMDFSKDILESQGYGQFLEKMIITFSQYYIYSGNYEMLEVKNLPSLWLVYLADPSDSGNGRNCSILCENMSLFNRENAQ